MTKNQKELIVGIFVCVGFCALAYTAIFLGKIDLFSHHYYPIKASFTSASGLKENTYVEVSGVRVGKVTGIDLEEFQAIVSMDIRKDITISDDAIASIRTNGILGEKYVDISPGGSSNILNPGETILDTEPPFDLLTIIKSLVVGE